MLNIDPFQKAIREEHLDGWLFCNFAHRDILTDSLLELDRSIISSRRWFYFIPASGKALKITHIIEKSILETLSGRSVHYSSKESLIEHLKKLAGKKIAVLSDPDIQVLSTLDASTGDLLHSLNIHTVSAASVVQRIKGCLNSDNIASHEKAGQVLYRIVHESWELVKTAFSRNEPLYEGDIRDFILSRFEAEGMITDHHPIVGSGPNTGNPHYSIPEEPGGKPGRGRKLIQNDVVQFDLWGKYPQGIYADISWIGFCGSIVPLEISNWFSLVIQARDMVKPALDNAFSRHSRISGAELDALVRSFLLSRCPPDAIQHRTGHGIDTECHGSGVNLDSTEFPDTRYVLEGSCFSVEPGIYFKNAGFRTEINIYISGGIPVISGGEIQKNILLL